MTAKKPLTLDTLILQGYITTDTLGDAWALTNRGGWLRLGPMWEWAMLEEWVRNNPNPEEW